MIIIFFPLLKPIFGWTKIGAVKSDRTLHLGLTIVRQIITAHGGTVVFRNQPGGGGIAEIMLPLSQSAGKS